MKPFSANSTSGCATHKGADLSTLIASAQLHVIELQTVLKQIVPVHPSRGGDAAHHAALNSVLSQPA
jgi:hypothetical protein